MRNILVLSSLLLPAAFGACSSGTPAAGTLGSDTAPYVIYMPQPASCFNGDVIVFAHGYVPVGAPAGTWLEQLMLPDGASLPALLNGLGFGFAASGFGADGLAIVQGEADTYALTTFIQSQMPVKHSFVTGASEGGLIAALLLQNYPIYRGGIAVCGPLGDFQKQIDYFTDVRVLFDYFFPGVLAVPNPPPPAPPYSAVNIAPQLVAGWYTTYLPAVEAALESNPLATIELINTARIEAGIGMTDWVASITGALWYNIFATTDAQVVLSGQPYDNSTRVYSGSLNDKRLNATVPRFTESPNIPAEFAQFYDTTGVLKDPMVTVHTLADPIVPYWQEPLYASKVALAHSSSELNEIPVLAYGHCNISSGDAEAAVALLLLKVAF